MSDFNSTIFFAYHSSSHWVWFVNFNDNVSCLNSTKLRRILKARNRVWLDKVRVITTTKMICGNLRHSLPVFWRHYGSRLGTTRRCSPRLIVDNELYQSLCNLNCTRMRNEVYSAVSCKVDWFFTTGSPPPPPPRHIHTQTLF